MKRTLLFFIVMTFANSLFCQDMIITKKADKIEAKVMEIGDTYVWVVCGAVDVGKWYNASYDSSASCLADFNIGSLFAEQ